jgi:leucyl aminopeptidase
MMLFLIFISLCFCQQKPGFRLIDFGPTTEPKWMSVEQVESLIQTPRHNFMDITDFQNISSGAVQIMAFPEQPTHKELVLQLIPRLSTDVMKAYNLKLTSFFNRYYRAETGKEAADYIYGELALLSKSNPSTSVAHFRHTFLQPSVIARIEGSGSNSDEIVIIGCHEDSTAGGATRVSPGSDDDASGVMILLDIFRLLMKETNLRYSRTIEFHFYAAEEAGLLGSQEIAASYKKAGFKVYSMLQLDMTIYPGKDGKSQFGIVTDNVNVQLTEFIRKLVDAYSLLDWVNTKCGYGCSDHASWTREGFASAFPFEGPFSAASPYIHTSQDTLDHYSLDHGLEFAKVALGYIIELASFPKSSRDSQ